MAYPTIWAKYGNETVEVVGLDNGDGFVGIELPNGEQITVSTGEVSVIEVG